MGFKIFRIVLQALGLLVLLAVTVFILSRWAALPAELPTRFDAAGQPVSYGARSGLVSLLAMAWVAYAVFTVLSYFPKFWNLPVKSPRAYRIAGVMMPVLGLVLALILSWTALCTALDRSVGAWFLPACIAGVGVPLLVLIIGSYRK